MSLMTLSALGDSRSAWCQKTPGWSAGGRRDRPVDFVAFFAALVEGRQHVAPDEPARTGNQYPRQPV